MLNLLVLMSNKSSKSNKDRTLETTAVLSSYTAQILSRHKYAKIHSVFPNGFNLNYKGYLVYVTYHQEGKLSALGMTIDRKVFHRLHPNLEIGQLVRFQNNRFTFYIQANTLMMNLKEQSQKDLKVEGHSIESAEWLQLKDRLIKMDLFSSSGFPKARELVDNYKDIHKKKEITKNHINDLIGAGIGLTPTGDDFLQGLILIEKILGHPPVIEENVKAQLKERSTTDVSLSYYEALFEGYYNEPLAKLFEAMSRGDERSIKKSILLLQDYGETSGFDLLTGILTYLQIIEDRMI